MLNIPLLLAQASSMDNEAFNNAGSGSSPKIFGTDVTIVLGVLLGLAAILFFWAFFIRKRPEQARGSLVISRGEGRSREDHDPTVRRKRRKRRAEHPSNWGRNPTLSETGGLPPERPDDPAQPGSTSTAPPSA